MLEAVHHGGGWDGGGDDQPVGGGAHLCTNTDRGQGPQDTQVWSPYLFAHYLLVLQIRGCLVVKVEFSSDTYKLIQDDNLVIWGVCGKFFKSYLLKPERIIFFPTDTQRWKKYSAFCESRIKDKYFLPFFYKF